ncbi:uncharacterized protein LOC119091189 [Pollicipes pollicipes]|uniref:uncharacterized protein LOC119091189 n=1 Tax=Pollicipes pollicipes TaxID=41117 RepID=UPI001885A293|nr:uncharacterized protein LOC119091189 [Pollicipes pollicipes]
MPGRKYCHEWISITERHLNSYSMAGWGPHEAVDNRYHYANVPHVPHYENQQKHKEVENKKEEGKKKEKRHLQTTELPERKGELRMPTIDKPTLGVKPSLMVTKSPSQAMPLPVQSMQPPLCKVLPPFPPGAAPMSPTGPSMSTDGDPYKEFSDDFTDDEGRASDFVRSQPSPRSWPPSNCSSRAQTSAPPEVYDTRSRSWPRGDHYENVPHAPHYENQQKHKEVENKKEEGEKKEKRHLQTTELPERKGELRMPTIDKPTLGVIPSLMATKPPSQTSVPPEVLYDLPWEKRSQSLPEVCVEFTTKGGCPRNPCGHLHVCPDFVAGQFVLGGCGRPHTLRTTHNDAILRATRLATGRI